MPLPYHAYQWITRAVIRTFATASIVMGLAMTWGGPGRFSSPGFATAREVPGDVYTWAGTSLLAGSVVLFGIALDWHRPTVTAGLFLAFFWHLFFALSLGISTAHTTSGAVTGPVAYGTFAILCMICAVGEREGRA